MYRSDLLEHGHTDSSIRNKLQRGIWIRLREGVYLDPLAVDSHGEVQASWLARVGPTAALSFATAARFHGCDSTHGWSSDTVISHSVDRRAQQASTVRFVRSRNLEPTQMITVDGLTYTSRVRTLVDVLSTVDVIEGERVLESALRGADPKRPDRWRHEVLYELIRFAAQHPRQPGVRQALILLSRRPDGCRPTGSIAETAGLQALRCANVGEIVCQPSVTAEDEHGNPRLHYLDFLLGRYRFDIEIDGAEHGDSKRRGADHERDRRLSKALTVLRFTADDALLRPDKIVRSVRDEIARIPFDRATHARTDVGQHELVGSGLEWHIVRRAAA